MLFFLPNRISSWYPHLCTQPSFLTLSHVYPLMKIKMSNLGLIHTEVQKFFHNSVLLFPSFLFADRRKGVTLPWFLEAKSLFCFGRSKIFYFRCPGISFFFFCLHLWSAVNIVRGFPEHKVYWKKILSHYDFIFRTNNLQASCWGFLLLPLLLFPYLICFQWEKITTT